MSKAQPELFDRPFSTVVSPNPVFCHQEFLEKLAAHRHQPVGKRAALLMQHLAIDERRQHYKSTQGANQGWRRSRLGGNQGSHFYAWWAPKTAAPIKGGDGFGDAPDGAVFLRDIRHHDDHSPARAQDFHDHYLPVSVPEMRREEYGPAPWTGAQARFAAARNRVRILKGFPGSGKTTALLHAADACGAERVLYVTYSHDLATLARQHFDRYCSRDRQFHVLTFEAFIRSLLRSEAPAAGFADLRRRLRGDLVPFSRSLGPWTDHAAALYDEWHAHLIGAALPVEVGRFDRAAQPRVSEQNYRSLRTRFVGPAAAGASLDLAARLERSDRTSLVERYFPELGLAWQAAVALSGRGVPQVARGFLDYDCIAVDECQDLTPIEAFVIVELAAAAGRHRGAPVSLFLAGDEAQTVRPTDFEWGWMNDLLHHRVGTPAEFKLAANLRSPRTIALLVNRSWDLYDEIEKRDRPSGAGYAEIEDDATDQVFYCTAAPGEELDRLMVRLASREGMAIVALDESVRQAVPETVRPSVLTASEVKGLDFHTVCLLNAGQHLAGIVRSADNHRYGAADIEGIRRRLAIDELRVALSRPADRLIWLDVNPASQTVRDTLKFLNRDFGNAVSPSIPAAVLTALEEEQLDLEERVQRCQTDARQFLEVRPEIAWSRAQQAVALLGGPGSPAAVADESVRQATRLTVAEICFCLAFRNVRLAPELGRPDLFREAEDAAFVARRPGLATVIHEIGVAVRAADPGERLEAIGQLAQAMVQYRDQVEAWLFTEIAPRAASWIEELESALTVGNNAATLATVMPPFYDALHVPDAAARKERLLDRAVRHLMKTRRYEQAYSILLLLEERKPDLEGECLESMGEYARAAETYRAIGKLKEALACYRSIPDFDSAAALIREIGQHPAAESYQWLEKLRAVIGERPQNFNRVMQAQEKKLLEQLLEQALGVARKKPAPRKAPARKTAKAGTKKRV